MTAEPSPGHLIRTARDARDLEPCRQLVRSPASFDGTFDQLLEQFIIPNLPATEAVEAFHSELAAYVTRPDALFLVRRVRGMVRGEIYRTDDSTEMKATDNAPAWWTHAALTQGYRIAPGAFAEVVRTMPVHLFEVPRACAQTANNAGWHIAHIFDVGDRKTDFRSWSHADVIGRFVRSIHPCNYILLPDPDWQRWGADARVIGVAAQLYAERYKSVWKDFVRLIRASEVSLARVTGPIAYAYSAGGMRETVSPVVAHSSSPLPVPVGIAAVEYLARRVTFKRDVIESLAPDQAFRVVTPVGTFQMTKAQFHEAFPNVVRSSSYRDKGVYHSPTVPPAAEQFRVQEPLQ